jgi:two-component system, chemotaxis family, CheB/CheR fusion protein
MAAAKNKKKKIATRKGRDPERKSESTTTDSATFPIVAIGASAGGLEAFSNLLRALPPEPGFAMIFIPHLDPTHESAMVELLSRTTCLPVLQAKEGVRVAYNSVYVLPPNSDMTISDGVLHLVRREAGRGHHMPIDTFLRSLATDQNANAVGVILSGTANDGTLGLSAIKHAGGITFAQDLETAKYDGMPNSAVAGGVVDYVLPPDRIAQELIRLQKGPTQREPGSNAFDGKDRLLKEIFRLLKTFSKVDFVDYKAATIRRRILRRMNITQVAELPDYVKLLHRSPQEVEALYRDVLINVTSFFRNPDVFDSLREVVYPKILVERSSSDPVRVWVPGCSTGEETYSHAISLVEMLSELRLEVPIQIFGTDLSEQAIQRARAGLYKENIANDVSEIRLRRFFHKVPDGYQISKSIRDMCVFARQNVFSDPPFARMDLISCRNVLIYLSPVLQKKVIPIFHYALKERGFLLVGNTEGLLGSGAEIFDLVDRKSKIYQKKSVPSPVTFGLTLSPHNPGEVAQLKPDRALEKDKVPKTPADVQREADRLLLTKYVPSAVVVNDDLEILQTRGRTNRYLELPTGKASLNLLKMARPGLLYELRGLIEKARKNSISVSKEGVVLDEEHPVTLRLEIIPFRTPARDQRHFLVLFEETENAQTAVPGPPLQTQQEIADSKDVQIVQLKQELASTKEYLQSIIEAQEATNEELQSANEEIQSGNEELQSTNEELQTSKEELESANEELNTVNEEIQHRNQQLAQLGNDLINLLHSATIPMVMLGEDLRIRRFTPEAERVLGFSSHDVGKALTHLHLNLDFPQLERWMLDVMRDVTMWSEQVKARDGRTYRLRITPYRTLENKIDGVVLTLLDINDLVGPDGPKDGGR